MPSALSRVDRDLLDEPNLAVSVLDAGLADVLNNITGNQDGDTLDAPTEADNLYSQLLTYTETGLYNNQATDVVSFGLQPCTGFLGGGSANTDPCTADADDNRIAVNGWLKQSPDPAMYYIDTDAAVGIPDTDSGRKKINPIYALDGVNFINNGFALLDSAYQGPHGTWLLDDGANDPMATLASDTASDNVNPTLSGDPTVGGTPADLQGDASWATDDHFGTAISPGTTGGLQTEGPPVDTSRSFTYTAWAKLTDTSKDQTALSQDSDSGRGFRLSYDHATNNWDLFVDDHTNPSGNLVLSQTAISSLNQWTGFYVEYNQAKDTFYLVVLLYNGVHWTYHTVPEGEAAETVPLSIGYDGSGTPFAGPVADVQAWSYGLSTEQMWSMRDTFFNQRTPH